MVLPKAETRLGFLAKGNREWDGKGEWVGKESGEAGVGGQRMLCGAERKSIERWEGVCEDGRWWQGWERSAVWKGRK